MLPAIIEHTFGIEGDLYRLVEYSEAGQDRVRTWYATSLAAAPEVIEILYGIDLYAKAVVRECLKEAPDFWWEPRPPLGSLNGHSTRVVTFEKVHPLLWEQVRKEVDAFIVAMKREAHATVEPVSAAVRPGADDVAPPETVSPVFQGRAS